MLELCLLGDRTRFVTWEHSGCEQTQTLKGLRSMGRVTLRKAILLIQNQTPDLTEASEAYTKGLGTAELPSVLAA